jgi:hypothetical protein
MEFGLARQGEQPACTLRVILVYLPRHRRTLAHALSSCRSEMVQIRVCAFISWSNLNYAQPT